MSKQATIDATTPEGKAELAKLWGKSDGGRKRVASKPCDFDGYRFDSQTERDRYIFLLSEPWVLKVDVHPVFYLAKDADGKRIRWEADFTVWPHVGTAHVEDVKSAWSLKSKRDFKWIWAEFDRCHPLAPLWVVLRGKGGWETKRRTKEKI